YEAPKLNEDAFTCPHCNAFSAMDWDTIWHYRHTTGFRSAKCARCKQLSIWDENAVKMVYPQALLAPLAHEEMPSDCKKDYNEAREIAASSARGAAALLRLCLQRLMPHLNAEGNNINENIKDLVKKGLSPEIQQALDYVRVIGNEAAHPGTISLEDNPDVVNSLFQLINFIVEDRIARPKKIATMFGSLPKGARDSVAKRDG
ncbi:DUF4145 domain-containing protein, partial [Vibrio parahaemolyticus]